MSKDMATAVKTQSSNTAKKQKKQTANVPEPKRLSKFALWRRENPDGILEYVDWQAANK